MRVIRYMSEGANQFRRSARARGLLQVPTNAPLTLVHLQLSTTYVSGSRAEVNSAVAIDQQAETCLSLYLTALDIQFLGSDWTVSLFHSKRAVLVQYFQKFQKFQKFQDSPVSSHQCHQWWYFEFTAFVVRPRLQ
jgi:hypothetical protein